MADEHSRYRRADIDKRLIAELIGMARGIVADNVVDKTELMVLLKWLVANKEITQNPLINLLSEELVNVLNNQELTPKKLDDVVQILKKFTSDDFEIGEVLKATTLPFCLPEPRVLFSNKKFCFTGNFVFGSRKQCEGAVTERGGTAGALTQKTNYLVIGEYATDSWTHSNYGRKIEKAIRYRDRKIPIFIISEKHWRASLS